MDESYFSRVQRFIDRNQTKIALVAVISTHMVAYSIGKSRGRIFLDVDFPTHGEANTTRRRVLR